MAILANRTKNINGSIEFIKFILILLKRSVVLFFIVLSLYIFIKSPKRLATISLEIVGYFISSGLPIYDTTFKQINLIIQKFIYLRNLAKENIELQLEIARLKRIQNNIESIEAENIALKKLLFVVEQEQYNYIIARLLTISLNPFSKIALVTAGTNHGVQVNQIVINSEGLIGRVIEASINYSKIMLVNDNNSRIPVTTLLSREEGILTGNANNTKILYLQENHLIQKDEKVVTSGCGHVYPAGITVGYVHQVIAENVIVKPIVNLSTTQFVSILLPRTE